MTYVNYDPVTGEIYQSGDCPNADCLPPGPENSEWLYGVMVRDIESHRVINGRAVARTETD